MDSRYCTYVIRHDQKQRWLDPGSRWVKRLKKALRFDDIEEARLQVSRMSNARHLHIEEAEKL